MPPETYTLQEILSDADAYFASGDAEAAVGVLFEGLDQFEPQGESHATLALRIALGNLCHAFWAKKDFDGAHRITSLVLDAALKRALPAGSASPAREFLDLYVNAAAMTGTTPFPLQRLFRHRNLIGLFRRIADSVEGDVAECGCARGLSFMQLCAAYRQSYPDWKGVGFHIFDSFQGLSEPGAEDGVDAAPNADARQVAVNRTAGNFAFAYEMVKQSVHRLYPMASLHQGWIPEVFAGLPERRYRFVHVNVDLYQPTRNSLRYFYPRLAAGGAIITDDYNWPGARQAFDEFCAAENLAIQLTDTSQAFLIKP